MRVSWILGLLFLAGSSVAQIDPDSIQFWGNRMLNDTVELNRIEAQEKVAVLIDVFLVQPGSSEITLTTVKSISALESSDKRFRIITWNLPAADGTYRFFGRVQVYGNKKTPAKIILLTDNSDQLLKPASRTLKPEEWYGAIYYQIVRKSWKKEVTYTLLGWDGNTAFSNKKLIDILYFDKQDNIHFGLPVFGDGKRYRHRVFFEFAERVSMSLRYQEKVSMIVFDHLSPTSPSMQGQYEFYSPDFTYDAFRFEKGKWQFVSDYEAKNEGEEKGNKGKKVERGLQRE